MPRIMLLGVMLFFLGCSQAPTGPAQPAVLNTDQEKLINDEMKKASEGEASQPQSQ